MNEGEFDHNAYPDQISCIVMSAIEGGVTEIEVQDAEANKPILSVPANAVHLLPAMPQLPQEMPKEAHEIINEGAGLGLVACRILERNDRAGLIKVDLPTSPKATTITVPADRIPRRR